MARSNKTNTTSTVTLHMEPEIRQVVDQTMMNFGLENRSSTICMIIGSWASAMLENKVIFDVCQQSVREVRKAEFEALARHFDDRAKLYKTP